MNMLKHTLIFNYNQFSDKGRLLLQIYSGVQKKYIRHKEGIPK